MKKKLTLLFVALMMVVAANAQFQEGKGYLGASLTGLDMSYSGAEKFNLGIEAKGGYLIADNLMPGLEMGYAFFINRSVTIEPAIYYDQSFKNHSDYSKIGFKVGVGIYLFDD